MRRTHTKKIEKPLRIAGYVRVSSQRQVNEGDSLLAQQHEIEQEVEFRKRRENLQVTSLEFYVDAGKSAKDQNRPQLQRLKRDIAAGKIDLVICFKLDRITRSLKDFVDLWALFAEHDVDVISLREKFDTSMPTGEAMDLLHCAGPGRPRALEWRPCPRLSLGPRRPRQAGNR